MYEYGRTAGRRRRAAVAAAAEFSAYMRDAGRRAPARSPREDLVSHLVAAEDGGERLTEDELVASAILLLNAGPRGVGQRLRQRHGGAAASTPTSWPGCARTAALVPTAIEEMIRFDSPLQLFERTARPRTS